MATRLLIKKALRNNQNPLKADEIGVALKTDHMLLLKAGVVGAVQETAHMSLTDMGKVFNLALPMKSMSGAIIFK